MRFTSKKKREYVKEPHNCPNCGAQNSLNADSTDLDDGTTMERRIECSACGERFREVWELKTIREYWR